MFIKPVNNYSGKRRNKQRGRLAKKPHNTQDKHRAAYAVNKPTHCYSLHPSANKRDNLSSKKKAEISIA
jgi:hypothetical protein